MGGDDASEAAGEPTPERTMREIRADRKPAVPFVSHKQQRTQHVSRPQIPLGRGTRCSCAPAAG